VPPVHSPPRQRVPTPRRCRPPGEGRGQAPTRPSRRCLGSQATWLRTGRRPPGLCVMLSAMRARPLMCPVCACTGAVGAVAPGYVGLTAASRVSLPAPRSLVRCWPASRGALLVNNAGTLGEVHTRSFYGMRIEQWLAKPCRLWPWFPARVRVGKARSSLHRSSQ